MEMRVDSQRIRTERSQRAWSQEHLAKVANLGLRTIQRIETAGLASNESISAIASALELPVGTLVFGEAKRERSRWLMQVAAHRLWLLIALIFVIQLLSPAKLTVALAGLWLWTGFEFALLVARRRGTNIS